MLTSMRDRFLQKILNLHDDPTKTDADMLAYLRGAAPIIRELGDGEHPAVIAARRIVQQPSMTEPIVEWMIREEYREVEAAATLYMKGKSI